MYNLGHSFYVDITVFNYLFALNIQPGFDDKSLNLYTESK